MYCALKRMTFFDFRGFMLMYLLPTSVAWFATFMMLFERHLNVLPVTRIVMEGRHSDERRNI